MPAGGGLALKLALLAALSLSEGALERTAQGEMAAVEHGSARAEVSGAVVLALLFGEKGDPVPTSASPTTAFPHSAASSAPLGAAGGKAGGDWKEDAGVAAFISGARGAAAALGVGAERLRLDDTQDALLALATRLLTSLPILRSWGLAPQAHRASSSLPEGQISSVGWISGGVARGGAEERRVEHREQDGARPPGAMLLAQLSYLRSCAAPGNASVPRVASTGQDRERRAEGGVPVPVIYTPASLRITAPYQVRREEGSSG